MGELHVRGINDKVLEEFREYVKKKYGKKHTVMGLEVEKALREYVERQRGEEEREDFFNLSTLFELSEETVRTHKTWYMRLYEKLFGGKQQT